MSTQTTGPIAHSELNKIQRLYNYVRTRASSVDQNSPIDVPSLGGRGRAIFPLPQSLNFKNKREKSRR